MAEDHIDIDLDKVKDPNEPAPEADYVLKVNKSVKKTSRGGDLMVMVSSQIQDPGGDEHGKFLNDVCMLEGGGARMGQWRYKEYCALAKSDGKDPAALLNLEFGAHLVVEPPSENFDRPSNSASAIFPKKLVKRK
jgi:hypothetical protein